MTDPGTDPDEQPLWLGWMSLSAETQEAIHETHARAHAVERLAVVRTEFAHWAGDQAEADHFGQSAGRMPLDPADVHFIFAEVDRLTAERDTAAAQAEAFHRQWRQEMDARQAVERSLVAERDEAGRSHDEADRRADRMREEAQHWAGRTAAAVDERGSAEARAHRAEAALERVRAVSVTYTDAVRGLSQNGSERDVARARHYRALLRDLDAALSAPADASGEATDV